MATTKKKRWLLNTEMDICDASSLGTGVPYNGYILAPVNTGAPCGPPSYTYKNKIPKKDGLYMYIIVTQNKQTDILLTKVHSGIEYKAKHANLVFKAKTIYDNGNLRLAGELEISNQRIRVNAFSGTYVYGSWMDASKSEQQASAESILKHIRELDTRSVQFDDIAFPMPVLTKERYEYLLTQPHINGFLAYKKVEDHDKATKLLSQKVLIKSQIVFYNRKLSDTKPNKTRLIDKWTKAILKTQKKLNRNATKLSNIPVVKLKPSITVDLMNLTLN